METTHDTMTDAGRQAYYDGYEKNENPELEDTDAWHAWNIGWASAKVEYELNIGEQHEVQCR